MAVWASTFISSKILLLEGLQPLEIFFCRFLLAYLCLPLLSRGRKWRSLSWRDECLQRCLWGCVIKKSASI